MASGMASGDVAMWCLWFLWLHTLCYALKFDGRVLVISLYKSLPLGSCRSTESHPFVFRILVSVSGFTLRPQSQTGRLVMRSILPLPLQPEVSPASRATHLP